MIRFDKVKKSFGAKTILEEVSFSIERGEIFFIIGTSGVGKSVLIKQLVGLLRPDSGEIYFDNQPLVGLDETGFYAIRKRCALVFQNSTLLDSLTCLENVALPLLKARGHERAESLLQAESLLERVQMSSFAASYPAALGDGLKKRVAVARALALEPEVILFDEPTTSLDPISARRVDALIVRLARDFGCTCVVVSHDLKSILGIADRIAMLYAGKVHALGTINELRAKDDPLIEQFLSGSPEGPLQTT